MAQLTKADIKIAVSFADIEDDVVAALSEMYRSTAGAVSDALGAGTFDRLNQRARQWAEERAVALITNIEETTRQSIADKVAAAGDPRELAAELEEDFGFSRDRAWTISRTELAAAHGESALEAAEESGLRLKKRWIRGSGDFECDVCQANEDAGALDLDEEFPSGDDTVPAHPNCVCDIVFEV